MAPDVVATQITSSNGGLIVPLLPLLVIAIAVAYAGGTIPESIVINNN